MSSRYVIETRLGEGGMGAVYRARHTEVGRPFAIKVLHPALVTDETVVARFRREAELAGRLRHDNVVAVVDMGVTEDNEYYLVLEYAPGRVLTTLLEDGPMTEARVIAIGKQLCDGLQHAHDAGVIHRDFKPDNVLVEQLPDGREIARIVDFGIAILRDDAGSVDGERLTTKGIVVGTPRYMAPEQARGGGVDHRIDLFALGLTLYELLAGTTPFDGTGVEVARSNVHLPTPPMGVRAPGVRVDPVLEAIVRKLLAKHPDDRLPSARAVRELLELYIRDRATAAALLGVRTIETSGLPPLLQLAAGRGRSANQSAAPYSLLIDHPAAPERQTSALGSSARGDDRDPPQNEPEPAPHRNRGPLAIALLIGAGIFGAALYIGLREPARPTTPSTGTDPARTDDADGATPRMTSDPAGRHESESGSSPDSPGDVIAEAPRKPLRVPPTKPRAGAPAPVSVPVGQGSASGQPTTTRALTANEVAALYMTVGRELSALGKSHPELATDLWPRYRWIRLNDAITSPVKRIETARLLEGLRTDISDARRQ